MKRHNQLISPTVAAARASYEQLGLCYTCGGKKGTVDCLHYVLSGLLDPLDYARLNVDQLTYNELCALREIIMAQRAERDKRPVGEAMRIDTGRLDVRRLRHVGG